MKFLEKEEVIWESKNKKLILTTHRLRELDQTIWGSSIKSIMLENISSAELKTFRDFKYLWEGLIYFLFLNGIIMALNQLLFKTELMQYLFGDFHIGAGPVMVVFYISLAIVMGQIAMFYFSVKKIFFFHSNGLTLKARIRWMDFEERENFISKVEEAIDKRINAPKN